MKTLYRMRENKFKLQYWILSISLILSLSAWSYYIVHTKPEIQVLYCIKVIDKNPFAHQVVRFVQEEKTIDGIQYIGYSLSKNIKADHSDIFNEYYEKTQCVDN